MFQRESSVPFGFKPKQAAEKRLENADFETLVKISWRPSTVWVLPRDVTKPLVAWVAATILVNAVAAT
jgi:hypothetical protein